MGGVHSVCKVDPVGGLILAPETGAVGLHPAANRWWEGERGTAWLPSSFMGEGVLAQPQSGLVDGKGHGPAIQGPGGHSSVPNQLHGAREFHSGEG